MTQTELIDYIQQMHPAMSAADARSYLNDASREFCRRTGLLEDVSPLYDKLDDTNLGLTPSKRWYDLSDLFFEAIEVLDVYIDNNRILKLSGTPDVFDAT